MSMLKKTSVKNKVSKQRFYDNINLRSKLYKMFVDYIDSIFLINKFYSGNTNLPQGDLVEEILFFEINLKSDVYIHNIEDLLVIIDRNVPYHTLFKIKYDNKIVCKMGYKVQNKADVSKFVVNDYYTRIFDDEKEFEDNINSCFKVINIDLLYENFLYLFLFFEEEDLIFSIEKQNEYVILSKELRELEIAVLKEKQVNRQYDLHNQFCDKLNRFNLLKKDIKKTFKHEIEKEGYI